MTFLWNDQELGTLPELLIAGDLDLGTGVFEEAKRCIEHGLRIHDVILSGDGSRVIIWFKRVVNQQAVRGERPEGADELLSYFRATAARKTD